MDATTYTKYPRTRHLPSSRSRTNDDKVATVQQVADALTGVDVVITEKMDGENTTIYGNGYTHARSINSGFHPSRGMIKELAAQIAHDIPSDMRISGENMFAVHSIEYSDLKSHFMVFNMWIGDRCLSWDETTDWAELLGLAVVPALYRGEWVSEEHAQGVWNDYKGGLPEGADSEGFVVRPSGEFTRDEFGQTVFKFVRQNHVQTGDHWMHSEMRVNGFSV